MKPAHVDVALPRINKPIDAVVQLPGSKSITNRALLIAALADGRSTLEHLPAAGDVRVMRAALERLGITIRHDAPTGPAEIEGCGGHWPVDEAELDARDAGTVARFLTAALCIGTGNYRLDGTPRLRERPIAGLLDALRAAGATVDCLEGEGRFPIEVRAGGLRGGRVEISDPESSQFLSALLMAAPFARQDLFITVGGDLPSRSYVLMTRRVMDHFGAAAIDDGERRFILPAGQRYRGAALTIEPDASSASYFLGLAALSGGRCTIPGLSARSWQGDAQIMNHLATMGCGVECSDDAMTVRGPTDGHLRGVDLDLFDTPDLAPTLAVLAAFAHGPTRLRGVAHLRFKESDRIAALQAGLRQIGAEAESHDDELIIRPAVQPRSAAIETHEDHRIAMSFSMAAARIEGMVIRDAACVGKSFPEFFDYWRSATGMAAVPIEGA